MSNTEQPLDVHLAKLPKPISEMNDDEIDALGDAIFDSLAEGQTPAPAAPPV